MFPSKSTKHLGIDSTSVPALTPVLKSETFFVWESDGTAVPISVVTQKPRSRVRNQLSKSTNCRSTIATTADLP